MTLPEILEAVRRQRRVVAAGRELGCSDAYIHVRLKRLGLSLAEVLDAESMEELLATRTA